MHEFSIADAVLRAALEVAESHGRRPIECVRLKIGQFRQVVPELLEFAFGALAQDTLAQGATLECTPIKLQVLCLTCDAAYQPEEWVWRCPDCGSTEGEISAGEELILDSVVLADR